jgi:hypothetical protein
MPASVAPMVMVAEGSAESPDAGIFTDPKSRTFNVPSDLILLDFTATPV